MLYPNILLEFALLLVEDELVDFFRVYLVGLSFLLLRWAFAVAFLEDAVGHVAEGRFVVAAVLLISLSGLLEFALHAADLSGEDVLWYVQILSEVFPVIF